MLFNKIIMYLKWSHSLYGYTSMGKICFEWVSDYCLMPNEQFFRHIMVRTSYILMRWWWCLLYTRRTPRLIVLTHWNNSLWVDLSLHSYTLFRFLANQSLLLLLTSAFFAKKHQIPIFCSLRFNLIRPQTHDISHLWQAC